VGHNQAMNDEPRHQTSNAGKIFVLLAVGGSAIGVVGWHLLSNRNAALDTTGFDMSSAPDSGRSVLPRPSQSAPDAPAAAAPNSLGMVKKGDGMVIAGPGGPAAAKPSESQSQNAGAGDKPASPKEEAALSFKDAAIKNEKLVDAFVRRMEAKHPSLKQYGKDWAASPELRALRDQYWKDKDPLKFAYGMAKSGDFGKLIKKYAGDPAMKDVLMTGIKEAPPSLLGAAGSVLANDQVAKELVSTISKAFGLPASVTGLMSGDDAKAPDANKVMSDIMNSDAAKGQMPPAAVPLEQKDFGKAEEAAKAKATNNGFTPLTGGR
jgi:hypothetical protein